MKKIRCPGCKEWADYEANPYRPFCSKECKEKDLGNWATERYRIEKQEQDAGNPLDVTEKPNKED